MQNYNKADLIKDTAVFDVRTLLICKQPRCTLHALKPQIAFKEEKIIPDCFLTKNILHAFHQ